MSKTKLSLLIVLVLSCAMICGMGKKESDTYTFDKDYKTMYEELMVKGRLDNKETAFVSAWCKDIVEGDVTWACMDEDYTTYQVNIKTDYTPQDIEYITLTDLVNNVKYLNLSPLKDSFSVKTIYVKYIGADEEVLAEFVISRGNDVFTIETYMVNVKYLEVYNDILSRR